MSDRAFSVEDLPTAAITLNGPAAPRLLAGHPWVFRSEIGHVTGGVVSGVAADGSDLGGRPGIARATVVDARGRFVGHGVLNPRSMIAVRLFSRRKHETINRALIRSRAAEALHARRSLLADQDPRYSACRLVFAEADGLPGLIVDKFGSILVFQSLAYAAEACRDDVLSLLGGELACARIVERNDAPVRALEGLPQRRGEWPADDTGRAGDEFAEIHEKGCHYLVDPIGGQKTGFYLDQRDNRAMVKRLAGQLGHEMARETGDVVRPLEVLDCFCYTGGFAVAAAAGAGQALGRLVCVESSETALALARANLSLNSTGGSARTEFVAGNAFDYLRQLDSLSGADRQAFDLVVLDPPPFARERRMLEGALRAYKEINLRAMRLLRPGGYLLTCTCSHHVGLDAFREALTAAAADAGVVMRVTSVSSQPADHPVLLGYPQGDYLRCLVLQRADGLR